jgi:hypothetical protein
LAGTAFGGGESLTAKDSRPLFVAAVMVLSAAVSFADDPKPSTQLEKRLQEINVAEAKHWTMHLDSGFKQKAELIERPVYYWTNPTKGGGQHGAVFVWTYEGRPVVVGSIFAHPTEGKRRVVHEFHSLAHDVIYPECNDDDPSGWEPKAGLKLVPLQDAPTPAKSAAQRLRQMKALGSRFGGHTVDWRKERWELRLLPQPLYRYGKTQDDVIDGALLALVTDAGTDPEILLLLEATSDSWNYALARFTDSSFFVALDKNQVFSVERGTPEFNQNYNVDHTYRSFQKRFLTKDDLGDLTETQP